MPWEMRNVTLGMRSSNAPAVKPLKCRHFLLALYVVKVHDDAKVTCAKVKQINKCKLLTH